MDRIIVPETGLKKLVVRRHDVRSLALGAVAGWQDGILTASPAEAAALAGADGRISLKEIRVAPAGASLRIGPVLDVTCIARCAEGAFFSGVTGPAPLGATRHVDVLDGAGLCVVASLPGVQEGIIDMAGEWSPLGGMHLLVCVMEVTEGVERVEADAAMRLFQCRLAERLAAVAANDSAGREEVHEWPAKTPAVDGLPRAGAVYLVQSQGALRATLCMGRPAEELAVQTVNPLEVLAGGMVSGNYVMPANKTCTLIHQAAPVIGGLMRRHGQDWDFAGVILACENSDLRAKTEAAERVAVIAAELGLDGVIVNQEGGGNADMDIMLACRELEGRGIRTVLLVNEFAGEDGSSPPLTEFADEARAVVSAGNNEHMIDLPAADAHVGHPLQLFADGDPAGPLRLPLGRIYASTNQLGFGKLSCASV